MGKKIDKAVSGETKSPTLASNTDNAEPVAFGAGGAPLLSPEDAAIIEGVTDPDGTTRPLTDSDIIEGFGMTVNTGTEETDAAAAEGDGVTATPGEASTDSLSPEPAAASSENLPTKKYKVGKREFDTPEAMEAYVNGREELLDSIKVTPAAPAVPEVNLEELMFENPKEYTRLIREQARADFERVLAEREAKTQIQQNTLKTWDDFYKSNPDLEDFKAMVDVHFEEVAKNPKTTNLPTAQGLELIAKRTRDQVNAIKLKLKPADELPAGRSGTIGSTTAAVPKVSTTEKVTSFADEIKGLRRGAVR